MTPTLILALLRRFWIPVAVLLTLWSAGYAGHRWLERRDARIRLEQQLVARDTIIVQRRDTAAAATIARRVDSVTVTRILTAVRHDTAWRHDTVRVAGDTTSRVAIPVGVLIQHDSAFAACDRLNHSCARSHLADSLLIEELRGSLAMARTGTAIPPPTRSCVGPALLGGALGAIAGRFAPFPSR